MAGLYAPPTGESVFLAGLFIVRKPALWAGLFIFGFMGPTTNNMIFGGVVVILGFGVSFCGFYHREAAPELQHSDETQRAQRSDFLFGSSKIPVSF